MQAVLLVKFQLRFDIELGLVNRLSQILQFFLVSEIGFLFQVTRCEKLDQLGISKFCARALQAPDRTPDRSAGTA